MSGKPITSREITARLSVKADFRGWNYCDRDNSITIQLLWDDEVFSEINVDIEPVGFVRDTD